MNTLKVKATIHCATCGCEMKRVKTIYYDIDTDAATEKGRTWYKSLIGQNCKVCQSIING